VTQRESGPAGGVRRAANENENHVQDNPAGRQIVAPWPESLTDVELKKLVAVLDAAVAATYELPGSVAEYDELLFAACNARVALRRRIARGRITAARQALAETGWAP
jgi:hypothetical protein